MIFMRKFLFVLLVFMTCCTGFNISVHAEDINPFPPQRPQVGVMKVDIATYNGVFTGLRTNGTINVKAAELNAFGTGISAELKNELLSLTNIVDVACTNNTVVALRADGTVYVGCNKGYNTNRFEDAASWTDIVAIETGQSHLVGLKSDGSVVATGENSNGQCDVVGWNNVSKIYVNGSTTIAIKKDGSVLATGTISNYADLRKYNNVKDIIKDRNNTYEVLYADGTSSCTDYVRNEVTDKIEQKSLNEIIENAGINDKVIKIGKYYAQYYVLTDAGDLFNLQANNYNKWKADKMEENIVYLALDQLNQGTYYAVDNNGQIWCNESAFTSDDWILTTNITYNGAKINSDVPPYIKDGRTLAPMRAILEALGMTVSWDGTTQTATAVKADININISINSNIAIVNGKQETLDVPAEITNGRTFVPVRFFAEALNMNVDWDAYTKTVVINSK